MSVGFFFSLSCYMITRGWWVGRDGWGGEGWMGRGGVDEEGRGGVEQAVEKAETLWKKVLRPDLGLLKGINNWIPN